MRTFNFKYMIIFSVCAVGILLLSGCVSQRYPRNHRNYRDCNCCYYNPQQHQSMHTIVPWLKPTL